MAHFGLYAVFALLLTRAAARDLGLWRSLVVSVVLAAAFGAADEWHQQFIPGRSRELADWVTDCIGGLTGAICAGLQLRARPGIS